MNRTLQYVNFAGIVLLAALCAFQWQANRRATLHALDLEKTTLDQSAALRDKDKTIQGNLADLNDFRDRLSQALSERDAAQTALKTADAKIAALSQKQTELQAAIDAQKSALDQWKTAVDVRDEALKKAGDDLQKLAAERNDAVVQFNELAGRYNTAQDQLKQAAAQFKQLADDRNDLVKKFNDLAARYNALVQTPPPATSQP